MMLCFPVYVFKKQLQKQTKDYGSGEVKSGG